MGLSRRRPATLSSARPRRQESIHPVAIVLGAVPTSAAPTAATQPPTAGTSGTPTSGASPAGLSSATGICRATRVEDGRDTFDGDERAVWRQVQVGREGQITERFTRAIEHLGKDKSLDERLGGIYALERIARDSPVDRRTITEVLTAYVRSHSPRPPEDEDPTRLRTTSPGPLSGGREVCRFQLQTCKRS